MADTHPNPLARGQELRRRLHVNSSAVGSIPVSEGVNNVTFRGNNFTDLVANEHLGLNSVVFRSRYGLIPDGSQMIVPWGHGWTAMESHSGGVLQQVNFMTSRKNSGSYKVIKDPMRGNWFPAASMSIDSPHHGSGPRDHRFLNLEENLNWRHEYYTYLQAAGRGLPLVPGTRSGESLTVAVLNKRYPGLFKGMIWMSPVHPTVGTIEGLEGYHNHNQATGDPINPTAFRWLEQTLEQMYRLPENERWWDSAHPVGNPPVPTLILVGGEDVETPVPTRNEYRRLAEAHPESIFYVEIPGAAHNVFATKTEEDKQRALVSWSYVYWFLRAKVLKDPNANPVPPEFSIE